ncbi:sugar porter family MFS transporter [Sphingomonas sp. CFBP 13728]|uniref:sugar porter family MFS transporter n=1 Tax=Sphingomonas sp. CFBP 13728 TaxID=2775294 RepID=UPI00177EBF73|nr:sugar porter family MFS transporter [Sphingomonas sp. CFBP 13728]MBD8619327.1 sugar porter family MFS transporter [Sphingomonas sp. CFBP 13728]
MTIAPTASRPSAQPSTVLIASVATAALAGLLFGFDTAVIAGVTGALKAKFALSEAWLGFTVSSALWGTLIGALFIGTLGDRYGSRNVLRILAFLYVVTALGCALAWNWHSFLSFRFINGIAIGGSSVLAPAYIAELAPPAQRGKMVGGFQFAVILGILLAYVSNAVIGSLDLGDVEWRWKLGIVAAPSLVFFGLLFRIPNSPRWLLAKGRDAEAKDVLALVGMSPDIARQELDTPKGDAKLSWTRHRKPITLAFLVAMFNQFSGINAFLYYLNDIFKASGGSLSPDLQAVMIGVANMVFTLLGMLLIDRIGRRTLLLWGSAGMTAALTVGGLALLGVLASWLLLPSLIVFIMFFAPGSGAVIWVYISEVFPQNVRARGSSIGSSSHWGWNAVIAQVFPIAAAWSAGVPFLFFAAMMAVQFVTVFLYFPETKGVPLEEMDAHMSR